MADIDPTLAAIIRSATTAADLAALAVGPGVPIADYVKAGVEAAIATAVRNGVLAVTPDADLILSTTGYCARFEDQHEEDPSG